MNEGLYGWCSPEQKTTKEHDTSLPVGSYKLALSGQSSGWYKCNGSLVNLLSEGIDGEFGDELYTTGSWIKRTIPYADYYSVTYGNDRFVAVGYGGSKAAYSTDGINWTQSSIPSEGWRAVAYGAGQFVAVGNGVASSSSFVDSNVIQLPNIQNTLVRLK